jgi:hypothetical protein
MTKHTLGELGDFTILDCGCKALTFTDVPWPDLEYCPMHKAAPDLLEQLEEALAYFEGAWTNVNNHPASHYRSYVEDYRAAIAKAGGQADD